MKSIRAMGCSAKATWRPSHAPHRISCSACCRSHACISEPWVRGFIRSLPKGCVGPATHFAGHLVDARGEICSCGFLPALLLTRSSCEFRQRSTYSFTGCFKKGFTTLKAYINLFRGHVRCFELS
jgi:hypothetical protein